MQNFRKAPDSIVEQVRRRLEKSTPDAELEHGSVKLCPIPGTAFDATVFRYTLQRDAKRARRVLVAELARPDVPHVYAAYSVTSNAILNAARIVAAILSLAKTIREDPRFERN